MKSNKKNLQNVITKLEQYYSNINEPSPFRGIEADEDLPNIINDKEYKTTVPLEDIIEPTDVKQPIIKTKKGKDVLIEPATSKDNQIKDVELFDKKGNEIEDWENDIQDLDRSEPEETVNDFDEDDIIDEKCKTPGNKIRSKGKGRGLARGKGKGPIGKPSNESRILEQEDEEDENNMGKLAQDNMGEQNPSSGQDPNIDPNETNPDPNNMMGGQNPNQNAMMGQPGVNSMGMMGGQDPMMDPYGGMQEPRLSAENVGRVFELKKIYSRLLSIESQLSFSKDLILLRLRKFITKATELFETVISNISSYRRELDGIIIMYYHFLRDVYSIMDRYYKIKEREDKQEKNKNKL